MKSPFILKVDPELLDAVPPLTDEEYSALEESIKREGVRDPLVVWGETIVDGHNRYSICQQNSIPFEVIQRDFADREEARAWAIRNQLARRNLTPQQRLKLAKKLEPIIREQARERQSRAGKEHGRGQEEKLRQELVEPISDPHQLKTDTQVGKLAGLSPETVRRYNKVEKEAPEIFARVESNEISINKGYDLWKEREQNMKDGDEDSIMAMHHRAYEPRPEDADEIKRISRVRTMDYSVVFGDGKTTTVDRNVLISNGWKKCDCCKGYGVVSPYEAKERK
jgi:hypothetical protein